jgi:hypothetical protein
MKNYAAFAISLIGVGSIDPTLLKMLIAVKVLQASPKLRFSATVYLKLVVRLQFFPKLDLHRLHLSFFLQPIPNLQII